MTTNYTTYTSDSTRQYCFHWYFEVLINRACGVIALNMGFHLQGPLCGPFRLMASQVSRRIMYFWHLHVLFA